MIDAVERARRIRLVIFDVDGVLTDGRLFFDHEGREYKAFHARDGYGIKMLQAGGVEVGIISGRSSPAVTLRMAGLGIEHVYQGQENKIAAFETLCAHLELKPEQVAHVGDDVPDLPVMQRVGLAVAVADAHASVHESAHWCTRLAGGFGAAREVCDFIMDAQATRQPAIDACLRR